MSRVVVDGNGRFVGYAYTGAVLDPGERIVDLSNADIRKLQDGWTVGSLTPIFDRLRAFRDSPRMAQVLGLGATEELTGNLLRNWAQDVTRFCQHIARDVITLYRNEADEVDPIMLQPGDNDAGPGDLL